MTATSSTVGFANAHASLPSLAGAPAWLEGLRLDSFRDFGERGFPTRRDEEWKYTNVRALADRSFSLADPREEPSSASIRAHLSDEDIALVFVDGVLSKTHSQLSHSFEGLTILPLSDALTEHEAVIRASLTSNAPSSASPFELLSRAFFGVSGAFIDIAFGAAVDRPIHILHVATKSSGSTAVFPRHVISVGDLAYAKISETYVGANGVESFVSGTTDVRVSHGGALTYCRVLADGDQTINIGATRFEMARDSRVRSFAYSGGGKLTRHDLDVSLNDPGANIAIDGLYLVKGKQHADNHTSIDHRVPDASSEQFYKGVLMGEGRGVFNGKVFVRRDAQRTAAQQLNKNLLLSALSEIDTKPELQIDADDVKCSHGATIGRLNPDEIFYLQSRGLEKSRAERLLTHAFAEAIIRKFGDGRADPRLLRLAEEFLA